VLKLPHWKIIELVEAYRRFRADSLLELKDAIQLGAGTSDQKSMNAIYQSLLKKAGYGDHQRKQGSSPWTAEFLKML